MTDEMQTEGNESWVKKWHIDPTIQLGTILVMLITVGTMAFSGAWWYSEVETRLQTQHETDLGLRDVDMRLAEQLAAQEKRTNERLTEYRLQQNRQFDALQAEVRQMRELLERIAFNTEAGERKK